MLGIRVLAQVLPAILIALCACSKHHLGARNIDPNAPGAGTREGVLPKDGPPCLVTELTAEIAPRSVTAADVLFVMDNTVSMTDEQSRCSCRCDAPEGYAQCACPDGFAARPC